MTLSEELKWRGFVNQTTMNDLSVLDSWQEKRFYNGYDASADSLTIGNLATIMLNKCFIRHDWQPVILAGGATSLIGDPGGKDSERPMQSEEQVAKNVACVVEQLQRLFGGDIVFVNNLDWFKEMSVLEFLRDIGKHFSMTPLVQRDYIAKRIGENGAGISYTEFSYTLLQGYDYLKLHQDQGVSLQLAGSDQWGNCLSGVDLVRRVAGHEVHALTMPLIINKTTGKKFGKSEAGAVWLDEAKTSVYDFYQFWLNVGDDGVEDYLKIFTELNEAEIKVVMDEFTADKAGRAAQKSLAYEVTKLVHGKESADHQLENTSAGINQQSADEYAAQNPELVYEITATDDIITALNVSGLAASNTEARQLLSSGGIYINDQKITDDNYKDSDFSPNGLLKLRRGKTLKNTVIIKRKV